MGILFQNTISEFSKTKNQTKKDPLNLKKTSIRRPQIIFFYKIDPPPPKKVGILIQNTISKFSKTKNQTKKDPLKFKKNQKYI